MIKSVFSILPASPVDLSQDIAVLELWRARTAPGTEPQEAGKALLRGFSSRPGQAPRTELAEQCHRMSLAVTKSRAGSDCRLTALGGVGRTRVHGQTAPTGLRDALTCSKCDRKRAAKSLTQEITDWAGATQAPAQKMMEIKHSIPILQVGQNKAQKILNHLMGCQHTVCQSCHLSGYRDLPKKFHVHLPGAGKQHQEGLTQAVPL